jgi:hypothetical protein
MAVKRAGNWASQIRADVPDMRAIESSVRNDFDELLAALILGDENSLVIRGFEINMPGSIGNSANSLAMAVADSAFLHGSSTTSGTFFVVRPGAAAEVLNSTVNPNVIGSFAPNSNNYVALDLNRQVDDTTSAPRAVWDPVNKIEVSKVLPLSETANFQIKITTSNFAVGTLPVCVVVTDAANNVVSIEDRRPLLSRLGTAGFSAPSPAYVYPWTAQSEGRTESPSASSNSNINPFRGGDKMLKTLKEWMDAVMSILREIKGTNFWYSLNVGGSLPALRTDAINTIITSQGTMNHDAVTSGRLNWSHDIFLRVVGSRLAYKISSNAATAHITLADNQIAYINLVRDQVISNPLIFTNGSPTVTSVGAVTWTTGLQAGDFIRQEGTDDSQYYQILTVDSLSQVTLTENFGGTSTGVQGIAARYAWGVYSTSASPSTNRHVYVANRFSVPINQDMFWLAFRDDNGGATPKVFTRFKSGELEKGESITIGDETSKELLLYIGSPSESDSTPDYTNANGGPTANVIIADGDSLTRAIKKLDSYTGAITWKTPVANFAALPGAGNTDGDVRLTLDTGLPYTWKASASAWIQIDNWKAPVANVAALPASNNADGDVRLVLDVRIPYTWHQSTTSWKPVNGIGGGVKLLGGGTLRVASGQTATTFKTSDVTNTSAAPIQGGVNRLMGPSWVANANGFVQEVDLPLTYISGTGNAIIDVYQLPSPGSVPVGGPITSSNPVDITTISTTLTNPPLTTFTFPSAFAIASGTEYAFVARNTSGASEFRINYPIALNLDATMGRLYQFDGTGGWVWDNSDMDFVLRGYVDTGALDLHFSSALQLEMKGLLASDNNIPAGSIQFPSSGSTAYVIPNLTTGGPNLTVTVGALNTVPANAVIIARREGNQILIEGTRLAANDYLELNGHLQEINRYFGQLRLREHQINKQRVVVTGADTTMLNSSKLSQTTQSLLMKFDGAEIDFETGEIFEDDGTTPLGIDFTPFAIPASEYFWYSVNIVAGSVNADNTINIQLLVLPADAADAVAADAPKAPFSDFPLGQVQVQESGGGIANITSANIVQLSASVGSGGGSGNEHLELIREQFEDSTYELVTPVVFALEQDDFTDAPDTDATFSIVKKGYVFAGAGDKWTSEQLIDASFLAEERDIGQVDVLAFWSQGEIDANAIWKVSRNDANEYQTITMNRVGTTDAFYGTLLFADEASHQVMSSNTAGGAGATEALNASTAQALGQAFTLTETWVARRLSAITVNKTGSPVGTLWFEICRDSAGSPGSVVGTSQIYDISSLAGGANVLTPAITAVLPAGTYHIVARTSQGYKDVFSAGVTEITLNTRTGSAAPDQKIYNGTTWSAVAGEALHYSLDGRKMVVKIEVESSAGSVTLMAVGLFYGQLTGVNAPIDLLSLIEDNKLGSTNPQYDRSVPGEGILLRAQNGDLVEVSVKWNGVSYELEFAKVT